MSERKISFEEAFEKLKEISEKIENENLTLDESIALFEEGVKLSGYCSKILEEAKQKITRLSEEN
ncbi:MAG: exodeoxyribonuclease VII small subunit [Clostridia bacterium]|nr:exodeoxyribonuclease VII small subunit [Clostridia bacterium]